MSGSEEGYLVLDPFSGSGTTALSAARNNRRWLGIDSNAEYSELAKARMEMELGYENDV